MNISPQRGFAALLANRLRRRTPTRATKNGTRAKRVCQVFLVRSPKDFAQLTN